jgi:hypothetical protein
MPQDLNLMCHCAKMLVEIWSHECFTQAGLSDPPDLTSPGARIIGVSHYTHPVCVNNHFTITGSAGE